MPPRPVAALLLLSAAMPAQDALDVGVSPFPPNVVVEQDTPTGFDIELWEEIAREADLTYEFRVMAFEQLLEAVRAGEVDAALAGITVNAEREAGLDFSYVYMESGLRILTGLDQEAGLGSLIQAALASGAAVALWYLFGFVFLSANLLWILERRGGAVSESYFPGVLEAAWCMVATMTTVGYGDVAPRRWAGRFLALAVMVVGIGLFGVLVAEMSAGLTLQQMRSSIQGPEDLAGKTVATVAGSTSVEAARELRARVLELDDVEAAIEAVLGRRAQAVIFDGSPLQFWLTENPDAPLALLPQPLDLEPYGISFPEGSPLREPVNRALLALRESGRYERLREKWFGPR